MRHLLNSIADPIARFAREHLVGMLLFAVGTGVIGNFVYDGLKGEKAPVTVPKEIELRATASATGAVALPREETSVKVMPIESLPDELRSRARQSLQLPQPEMHAVLSQLITENNNNGQFKNSLILSQLMVEIPRRDRAIIRVVCSAWKSGEKTIATNASDLLTDPISRATLTRALALGNTNLGSLCNV